MFAVKPGGVGNRGERHVHQRENGPAVRVAHAVAVALVQRHDRHAMLRPDFEELNPHVPGERIIMVEMVTDFFVRRHPALLMRVRRPSRGAGKRCSQGYGSPLRAHPQPSAYEHFFFENASPARPLHLLPAPPQGRRAPPQRGKRHAKRPPANIGGKPSCAAIPAGNASPGGIRNSARLAAVSPHSRMKRGVLQTPRWKPPQGPPRLAAEHSRFQ